MALLGLIFGSFDNCLMAVLPDSLTWLNDPIYPMMVVNPDHSGPLQSYPGLVARLWDLPKIVFDYLNDTHHR